MIIGNFKTHETVSYTVLPLAINRHLNEGKGEGLGEWCQPTCESKPRDFGRKVLSTTQAVLSLMSVRIRRISPAYLQQINSIDFRGLLGCLCIFQDFWFA